MTEKQVSAQLVTALRWANTAHDAIDCTVVFTDHPSVKAVPIPFHARADDPVPYGAQLYRDIVEGKYGSVAECVEAPDADQSLASKG